jgi:glycosyltransferase involved in cell wall biosynthesis
VTRILVVGLHYPPHHLGGYEVSCRDVVDRLAARGHDLTVLTSTLRRPGVSDPPDETVAPVPVHRVLAPWFRDEALYAPSFRARWRMERANQAALTRLVDEVRPEVVAVWQMGALSLGLLATIADRGLPMVHAVSDDWLSYSVELDAWSRMFRRWPRPLAAVAASVLRVPTTVPDLGHTGPFCFISEDTRRRAAEYAPWSMDDTALVYSGIDGRLFTPSDARPPDRPWTGRLLYVGRYDGRKGIETAVRALAQLPEATTLEVQGTGDPAERARLEAIVDELGLGARVAMRSCTRDELVERYRQADALVFPSEWEEPFGLVPLEAMACGTPVIATGVGGSGEFLLHEANCLRFEPRDPGGLAVAVDRLASDAALRARLVGTGLRTARVFDIDRLADCFEGWYTAAAEGFGHGRPASRSFTEELRDAGA